MTNDKVMTKEMIERLYEYDFPDNWWDCTAIDKEALDFAENYEAEDCLELEGEMLEDNIPPTLGDGTAAALKPYKNQIEIAVKELPESAARILAERRYDTQICIPELTLPLAKILCKTKTEDQFSLGFENPISDQIVELFCANLKCHFFYCSTETLTEKQLKMLNGQDLTKAERAAMFMFNRDKE